MHYLSMLLVISAGLYTLWDSLRRGRSFLSAVFWGLGVTLLFIIFFPLHLLTRPKMKTNSGFRQGYEQQRYQQNNPIDITDEISLACPNCGNFYSGNPSHCPHCGTSLKAD
ncbi:hypothetical protein JOC37_000842 [Desulfohalotomaculum tongense]|uniref:hypothetical protein n=1 Tax=Desulforadius tongensis TaxID=1216062 RepID=UPI00195E2158|nr:hypothetical protein [Desulforadius tongensis]MBM7854469.1 hypothetical protein [Desulforadius tongensis]